MRINIVGRPSEKLLAFAEESGFTLVMYSDDYEKMIADAVESDEIESLKFYLENGKNRFLDRVERCGVYPVSGLDFRVEDDYVREDTMRSFLMGNKFQRKRGRF